MTTIANCSKNGTDIDVFNTNKHIKTNKATVPNFHF